MAETMTVTLSCPFPVYNEGEDDTNALPHECGADIDVVTEWEDGDPRYGADRDGNRWMNVPGQWVGSHTTSCKKGHKIDGWDEQELFVQAEKIANKE